MGVNPLASDQRGFLSTLSLRRATNTDKKERLISDISIHVLLAESDLVIFRSNTGSSISIHALLAESDAMVAQICAD